MALGFRSAVLVAVLVAGAIGLEILGQLPVAVAQTQGSDRKSEADRLLKQGIQQYQTSQFTAALQSWEQALALYRKINDRRGEGQSLGNLGVAYRSLGIYGKAIEYNQQSLAIAREVKNRLGEGQSLGNLGGVYQSLGNYGKAIEYHQRHLAIAREVKNRLGEGTALNNLGLAYGDLGNYGKAIEYHQRHLAIAREVKNRLGEGTALNNLGLAYGDLGNYGKAIEYHQQSLAIAREIKDRRGEGQSLGNLGVAYQSLGNYGKAIEYHQQYLVISREVKDRSGEGTALNNLGFALLKTNDLANAEKVLSEGIEVRESLRVQIGNNDTNKVSIFEEQARTYRILQQVLIAANKTTAALEIAERGRARAFVEQLTRRLQGTAMSEFLTIKPATFAQMQQIAKSHNATLVQYSIIYDNFEVQGKQKTHETNLYIWVIKPTGEVSFRKADLKPLWQQQSTSLSALVNQSRDALGTRSRNDRAEVSVSLTPEGLQRRQEKQSRDLKQLHQLLIDPIADLLPTTPNDRVIFIPQGPLFLVPFPALQAANGNYLIQDHTILTAPSIQVLALTRTQRLAAQRSATPSALVVGNPTMPKVPLQVGDPPQQLAKLPGAEQEAIAIAPLLQTKALIGNQGRKTAIVQQMPNAQIIHLATHGILDDRQGLSSAIALAPNPNQPAQDSFGRSNGLLTAEEILDLKLKADLVVLSACDTGRGKITGDGVIGLSRSFISAGVPSLIVSLWAVPDAPTAELMTEFYTNWRSRKLDKAQALRQAMLTTLKTHPNPRDWAAFTLIGESE